MDCHLVHIDQLQTDRQTDILTLVLVKSLSRLKRHCWKQTANNIHALYTVCSKLNYFLALLTSPTKTKEFLIILTFLQYVQKSSKIISNLIQEGPEHKYRK